MATRTTSEPKMPPIVLTAIAVDKCHTALKSDDEDVRDAGHTILSYLTFGLRQPQLVLPESCASAWGIIKDL